MRKTIPTLTGILTVLAATFTGTGPAAAGSGTGPCYGTNDVHCYTVMQSSDFNPRATRINAQMNYQCLVRPAGWTSWSSVQTMWAPIDAAANGGKDGFVETGIWNQQGPPSFYWVRSGGTYGTGLQMWETGVQAPANNSNAMRTQWNPGNGTWTIYNRGVLRGTLSSPNGPIKNGMTGGESTTNSGSHNFDTWGLQRVQNGVTYAGFPGAANGAWWQSPPWANPPMIVNDGELQTRKTATGAQC